MKFLDRRIIEDPKEHRKKKRSFFYPLKMSHKIKNINLSLDKIYKEAKKIGLIINYPGRASKYRLFPTERDPPYCTLCRSLTDSWKGCRCIKDRQHVMREE